MLVAQLEVYCNATQIELIAFGLMASQRVYCPPIDSATFLAIISDYDLTNAAQAQSARELLDQISATAFAEEATGFDPSGSTAHEANGAVNHADESDSRSTSSVRTHSLLTDTTSVSQGIASLTFEDSENGDSPVDEIKGHYDAQFEALDEAGKTSLLMETFPQLKSLDIASALRKTRGNAGAAFEHLMTLAFLEDTGDRQKGVDGLYVDEVQHKPRKHKKKTVKRESSAESSDSAATDIAPGNKWETSKADIKFLTARISMDTSKITNTYNQQGRSLQNTIKTIVADKEKDISTTGLGNALILHAEQLCARFPDNSYTQVMALLRLTGGNESHVRDLINAMTFVPSRATHNSPIHLEFRLAPPDLGESTSTTKSKPASSASTRSTSPSYRTDVDHWARRDGLFAQAAGARRQAKSDNLMAAAAAVYSERAHDENMRAKAARLANADAIVSQQSTSTSIDLHGVTVKDGVRITRERVEAWWVNHGSKGGSHGGFKIITGKGTHSEGGRSRLGPEISRMLIVEGWRVEILNGALRVTGVATKGARRR